MVNIVSPASTVAAILNDFIGMNVTLADRFFGSIGGNGYHWSAKTADPFLSPAIVSNEHHCVVRF